MFLAMSAGFGGGEAGGLAGPSPPPETLTLLWAAGAPACVRADAGAGVGAAGIVGSAAARADVGGGGASPPAATDCAGGGGCGADAAVATASGGEGGGATAEIAGALGWRGRNLACSFAPYGVRTKTAAAARVTTAPIPTQSPPPFFFFS